LIEDHVEGTVHEKHRHSKKHLSLKGLKRKTMKHEKLNTLGSDEFVSHELSSIDESDDDEKHSKVFSNFDINNLLKSKGDGLTMKQVEDYVQLQISGFYDSIYKNTEQFDTKLMQE